MPEKKDHLLERSRDANEGFFSEIYNNLRLIVRLLKDRRVNFFLKFLPIGAIIYLVIPFDFFPINPLDDTLVFWLGGSLFIQLCPDIVVQEHRIALRQSLARDKGIEVSPPDVVDAEFREVQTGKET